ncbi:hypothetical protein J6590_048979 [Homalodisca vitripennis]|nr:hypothetical protein J6590_048979 [Homalodisca vitripennis]
MRVTMSAAPRRADNRETITRDIVHVSVPGRSGGHRYPGLSNGGGAEEPAARGGMPPLKALWTGL